MVLNAVTSICIWQHSYDAHTPNALWNMWWAKCVQVQKSAVFLKWVHYKCNLVFAMLVCTRIMLETIVLCSFISCIYTCLGNVVYFFHNWCPINLLYDVCFEFPFYLEFLPGIFNLQLCSWVRPNQEILLIIFHHKAHLCSLFNTIIAPQCQYITQVWSKLNANHI